jgi:hypothetical protein
MDRFCALCGIRTKTYAGLAKHNVRCYSRRHAQEATTLTPSISQSLDAIGCDFSTINRPLMSRDEKTPAYESNSHRTSSNSSGCNNEPDLIPPYASDTTRRLNESTTEDGHIGRKGPLSASTQTWEEQFSASGRRPAGVPIPTEVATLTQYAIRYGVTLRKLTIVVLKWRNPLLLTLHLRLRHGYRE